MGTTLRLVNAENVDEQIFAYMSKGSYEAFYDVKDINSYTPEDCITDDHHRACYRGHTLSVTPQTFAGLDFIAVRINAEQAQRAEISNLIQEYTFVKDGERMVYVEVFTRDCDHREQTILKVIPATLRAYLELLEDVEDNAENGFSVCVLSEEQARYFEPSDRDRVMEAYEDGHPHCIY